MYQFLITLIYLPPPKIGSLSNLFKLGFRLIEDVFTVNDDIPAPEFCGGGEEAAPTDDDSFGHDPVVTEPVVDRPEESDLSLSPITH